MMKIAEDFGDFVVVAIDSPNTVHEPTPWKTRRTFDRDDTAHAHLPSTALTPSQSAPIKPVAISKTRSLEK
ncbi:hypothetical protein QA640_14155 [Bradyrhizobium sp. CB82]|uniref:hypothetical protein n=1 Tax=Bradyrhizobium sp. CB82 TaxID=3039159 RepID=UPI0024B1AB34|nr:hypothetical protein [Bradyrhizobium sp. CB82]WFU45397.1 hypothetical protein QA640_14155 [Bradyrhizobium sp. CB82]